MRGLVNETVGPRLEKHQNQHESNHQKRQATAPFPTLFLSCRPSLRAARPFSRGFWLGCPKSCKPNAGPGAREQGRGAFRLVERIEANGERSLGSLTMNLTMMHRAAPFKVLKTVILMIAVDVMHIKRSPRPAHHARLLVPPRDGAVTRLIHFMPLFLRELSVNMISLYHIAATYFENGGSDLVR